MVSGKEDRQTQMILVSYRQSPCGATWDGVEHDLICLSLKCFMFNHHFPIRSNPVHKSVKSDITKHSLERWLRDTTIYISWDERKCLFYVRYMQSCVTSTRHGGVRHRKSPRNNSKQNKSQAELGRVQHKLVPEQGVLLLLGQTLETNSLTPTRK